MQATTSHKFSEANLNEPTTTTPKRVPPKNHTPPAKKPCYSELVSTQVKQSHADIAIKCVTILDFFSNRPVHETLQVKVLDSSTAMMDVIIAISQSRLIRLLKNQRFPMKSHRRHESSTIRFKLNCYTRLKLFTRSSSNSIFFSQWTSRNRALLQVPNVICCMLHQTKDLKVVMVQW